MLIHCYVFICLTCLQIQYRRFFENCSMYLNGGGDFNWFDGNFRNSSCLTVLDVNNHEKGDK